MAQHAVTPHQAGTAHRIGSPQQPGMSYQSALPQRPQSNTASRVIGCFAFLVIAGLLILGLLAVMASGS